VGVSRGIRRGGGGSGMAKFSSHPVLSNGEHPLRPIVERMALGSGSGGGGGGDGNGGGGGRFGAWTCGGIMQACEGGRRINDSHDRLHQLVAGPEKEGECRMTMAGAKGSWILGCRMAERNRGPKPLSAWQTNVEVVVVIQQQRRRRARSAVAVPSRAAACAVRPCSPEFLKGGRQARA
jgi:hypothetical protein